jgi:hypothetical protein
LLGYTTQHPNTAGQSQQRSHEYRFEEAAEYIVHQPQAYWRFELSDSRSQKEVSKSHASNPYDD